MTESTDMKIGYIGLGKMGQNMVQRLLEQGIEVVVWNRSAEPIAEAVAAGAAGADSVPDLVDRLADQPAKVIWLMVPAGQPVTELVSQLGSLLAAGDTVIDGGNSFFKDTLRNAQTLAASQIRLVDVGVSGGPTGARQGACLMVGGRQADLPELTPLFEAAAAPTAVGYLGQVGSGHFAKMVHNGIEYGMMQAIAEGAAILKAAQFELDLADIFRVYNQASVIESRLIGWIHQALAQNPELENVSSQIEATGEGHWTAQTAEELAVDAPVITTSVAVRDTSAAADPDSITGFRNKVVSALRSQFGGHSTSQPEKRK